jgi:hypothetical protein
MPFADLATNSQTDPRPRIGIAFVQALRYRENQVEAADPARAKYRACRDLI